MISNHHEYGNDDNRDKKIILYFLKKNIPDSEENKFKRYEPGQRIGRSFSIHDENTTIKKTFSPVCSSSHI
jgi:hypothetical protein